MTDTPTPSTPVGAQSLNMGNPLNQQPVITPPVLAGTYDGYAVLVITDMSTVIPDVATMLNNLKLGLHDELVCFVRRAGS